MHVIRARAHVRTCRCRFQVLDGVSVVLRKHPEIKKLTVEGHTCSAQSWGMTNQELSALRAQSVQRHLSGLLAQSTSRTIVSIGFGEDRPLFDNKDRALKRGNRRCEFLVY